MKGISALLLRYKEDDLVELMKEAAEAAEQGANETAAMRAKSGRASYVSQDLCTRNDPGAQAVAIVFNSVFETMKDDSHTVLGIS